ncbi:enolase-phosphatase E1-like [Ischnura elegans]|uniref:enolase-phosphatase E1-like n=1 Tax=Ischnura elegans TaxID=197161 RepID=UPI001ED8A6AF|nr:enolase-phosphatase E1-like [Ischnura elegans]
MDDLIKAKDHKIEDIVERLHSFQVVLSDIEGTTTSISFVRNVLKTYCIQKLDSYITEHWDSAHLLDIRRERESTGSTGCKNTNPPGEEKPNSLSKSEKDLVGEYLLNNINSKEASYASKFLLTKIWEEGYKCGDLKGQEGIRLQCRLK